MSAGLSVTTLARVRAESERAVAKHGLERSALSPALGDAEKLAILVEEVGEVARAMTYDEAQGLEHLRAELVQVSSVAACWAQAIDARLRLDDLGVTLSKDRSASPPTGAVTS